MTDFFFFFSSRRRHTRFKCDWSSDVCSSDLATALATVYHYVFGWAAPYEFPSLPKLLGAVGGTSLMLGTAGLWRLNRRRHPLHGDARQKPMDLGFIALLFLVAASGMALWLGR